MTDKPTPLAGTSSRTDVLLHYIPLLRKALAMPEDPQENEDEFVKDLRKRTETQTSDGH